jgi:hypothetical protein
MCMKFTLHVCTVQYILSAVTTSMTSLWNTNPSRIWSVLMKCKKVEGDKYDFAFYVNSTKLESCRKLPLWLAE